MAHFSLVIDFSLVIERYDKFVTDMRWDSSYLLHLGIYGPNVNLKFQSNLKTHFKESYYKEFLDIDTCTLHKVHALFKKGVLQLPIAIDNFAVSLHGFFKLSSARREDYSHLEDVSEVTAHYVHRDSSARCLTMKFVLVRIIERWPNLKEYFITFLPKQKELKELKQTIKETKRCQQMVEVFENELALPYLPLVNFLAHRYESYLLKFQSEEPLIQMLHSGMSCLTDLMQNFVNKKSLFDVFDVVQVLKPVHSLIRLNQNRKESLKCKSFIDVGTHAKLLLEGIFDDEKLKGFRSSCLKSYVAATTYLQQNLPFNNKITEYAQYLHPQKRNHSMAKSGIKSYSKIGQGVWKEITSSI